MCAISDVGKHRMEKYFYFFFFRGILRFRVAAYFCYCTVNSSLQYVYFGVVPLCHHYGHTAPEQHGHSAQTPEEKIF